MIARASSIAGRRGALMVAVFVSLTGPCGAQVMPAAPQSPSAQDGTDGPGFIRVPSSLKGGTGGFVDVTGYASCRYVTTTAGDDATKNGEVIPVGSLATWQSYLGRPNPEGDTDVVCCRPKSVTLCQLDGATPQTVSLPYTVLGDTQQPVANCTDAEGYPYKDMQTWVCDETGSGVTADGLWQQQGPDQYTCAPNAYTTACTVACGGGTQTTYDSCGNVQAVTACNTQACCTPSYSKSCSNSTAVYTDVACGTGSYDVANGCTSYSCVVGGSSCSDGSRTTISGGYEYFDCGSSWVSWGQQSGCVVDGYDYETDYGPPNFSTQIPVNAGPDHTTCYGTCWE